MSAVIQVISYKFDLQLNIIDLNTFFTTEMFHINCNTTFLPKYFIDLSI